jgi:4-oxalomesaconate hydratase
MPDTWPDGKSGGAKIVDNFAGDTLTSSQPDAGQEESGDMSASDPAPHGPLLVVSAHAGDFVWRAGGAMALAAARGAPVTVLCLSYGERGESAAAWRDGKKLDEIKAIRRAEATLAAQALGASIEFLDAGDYPLRETDELVDALVRCYRRIVPAAVLTHTLADPYNGDHAAAARMALQARVLAQAIGYEAPGAPLGAPPVFPFEPHQPEQCDFKPDVLLDITDVFDTKRNAMECLPAQRHMWDYYTELARRRGVQFERNAGPNLGLLHATMAEAYMRLYPETTRTLR